MITFLCLLVRKVIFQEIECLCVNFSFSFLKEPLKIKKQSSATCYSGLRISYQGIFAEQGAIFKSKEKALSHPLSPLYGPIFVVFSDPENGQTLFLRFYGMQSMRLDAATPCSIDFLYFQPDYDVEYLLFPSLVVLLFSNSTLLPCLQTKASSDTPTEQQIFQNEGTRWCQTCCRLRREGSSTKR